MKIKMKKAIKVKINLLQAGEGVCKNSICTNQLKIDTTNDLCKVCRREKQNISGYLRQKKKDVCLTCDDKHNGGYQCMSCIRAHDFTNEKRIDLLMRKMPLCGMCNTIVSDEDKKGKLCHKCVAVIRKRASDEKQLALFVNSNRYKYSKDQKNQRKCVDYRMTIFDKERAKNEIEKIELVKSLKQFFPPEIADIVYNPEIADVVYNPHKQDSYLNEELFTSRRISEVFEKYLMKNHNINKYK
jgi:hypothetical protein